MGKTKIMPAVGAVSHAVQKVQRDGTNPHFKSKYVTLEALMDAVRDPLVSNGLTLTQTFSETDGNKVNLITTLWHVSGEFIESVLSIPLDKKNAQAVGSAITYGRRYSLSSLLGIVDTNDDDGNRASERNTPHTKLAKSCESQKTRAWSAFKRLHIHDAKECAAEVLEISGKKPDELSEDEWQNVAEVLEEKLDNNDPASQFNGAMNRG